MDRNLDTIVDTLLGTQEFRLPSPEELGAFEESNPHPDDGAWLSRPLEIISRAVILSYAIWIYCGSSADWILKFRCWYSEVRAAACFAVSGVFAHILHENPDKLDFLSLLNY